MYYHIFAQIAVKNAACVMTISEHSKRDLVNIFGVLKERISVVYLSANPIRQYFDKTSTGDEVMKRLAIDGRFIFALGALDPRKNTLGILNAFARLKKLSVLPLQLVIAGLTQDAKRRFDAIVGELYLQKQVILLGFVSERQLSGLYKAADVFVYPSLYEGFGIPILEAMEHGTPVVTSSTSSIPEVAGKAALFVDPNNPEEIAHAVLRIITDAELRNRIIENGFEQANRFSWEKTAQQMMEIYRMSVKS
jgi:glycosyltransferase involved in cell wall biosynthesis